MSGAVKLLGLALVLALVRHVAFWDAVAAQPGALLDKVTHQPVVREWTQAAAMQEIQAGRYQPVDLRRLPGIPIIGGQLAWQLPMPLSLTILDRYREAANAKRLMFLMTDDERAEGERTVRDICGALKVRDAGLVVWRNE